MEGLVTQVDPLPPPVLFEGAERITRMDIEAFGTTPAAAMRSDLESEHKLTQTPAARIEDLQKVQNV